MFARSQRFKARKDYLQKVLDKLSEKDIPRYLQTEQLVSHGLDAKVVSVKDNIVQFDPSFFKPQDEDISTRFAIDTECKNYRPCELHDPPPDWDEELKFAFTCIRKHHEDFSPGETEEKAYSLAKDTYEAKLGLWKEDQANPGYYHHGSGRLSNYIHHLKWAPRKDIPPSLQKFGRLKSDPDDPPSYAVLRELTPLAGQRDIHRSKYPHRLRDHSMKWFLADGDEDIRKNPVPHAILTFEVRFLLNRCHPGSWRRHDCSRHLTQPVLLISCVGRKHGRITQAYYDETGLHLQCTELMSFEANAKLPPPVDLFLRYSISLPAGIERAKNFKSRFCSNFLKVVK